MNEALDIAKAIFGSTGGSFAAVFFFLVAVSWVSRKVERILADHDTLSAAVERIKSDLDSIKLDVMAIKAREESRRGRPGRRYLQAHSPVSLTEDGRRAAADIDAEGIVAEAWESRLLPAIRAAAPDGAAYDVQQFCLERLAVEPEKYLGPESVSKMKRYAFDNGATLFEVASVVGVVARDRFLAGRAEPAPAAPEERK